MEKECDPFLEHHRDTLTLFCRHDSRDTDQLTAPWHRSPSSLIRLELLRLRASFTFFVNPNISRYASVILALACVMIPYSTELSVSMWIHYEAMASCSSSVTSISSISAISWAISYRVLQSSTTK